MDFAGYKKTLLALWAATAFIGIAYLTITPPFEAFDESAHYSRIVSTASVVQPPFAPLDKNVAADRLTAEIDDYMKIAPLFNFYIFMTLPTADGDHVSISTPPAEVVKRVTPEYYVAYDGLLSWNAEQKFTYDKFFADNDRLKSYIAKYREMPAQNYTPGRFPNWEYQHPPLYYYLMIPVARLLAGQPLIDKIILLRLVSYALVLAGLAISLHATFSYIQTLCGADAAWKLSILCMMFPFLFPSFGSGWLEWETTLYAPY